MARSDKEHKIEGIDLINQLSIVLKNGVLHSVENDAVLETIVKLLDIINPSVAKDGMLRIDLIGEFFYINDTRMRYALEHLVNFDYLTAELKKRGVGSVSFLSTLSAIDIKMFITAFINSLKSEEPFDTMSLLLKDLPGITIDRLKKVSEEEGDLDKRSIVKRTYFNAVSYTKGVMSRMKSSEPINLKRAKRVVETLVDAIISEEQLIIGMTSLKDYDEYTYNHSVNVSILSIAIGQRIGLNRHSLTCLGIAALFHDMGKTEIPKEVLNKASYLSADEWVIMKRHTYLGALSILKLKEVDEVSIHNALVAFQHHINYDSTGYPVLQEPTELLFYSKIIALVDQYDAMTSSRVYRKDPMPPDKALGIMIKGRGIRTDPILLKIFVNMVGAYPVGSLVLLDTREMGIVVEGSYLIADRPKVLIIVNASGEKLENFVADLAEQDSFGGYKRTVIKTLDPKKYNLSLAEYLL